MKPIPGAASEKRPNAPVAILPSEPVPAEIVVDLNVDGDLFGTDDLIGIDTPTKDDEGASE